MDDNLIPTWKCHACGNVMPFSDREMRAGRTPDGHHVALGFHRACLPNAEQLRRFILQRDEDVSGVSGTGIVAWGVLFPDGVVALRWKSAWPTSVVFHDRGMDAVQAVHGHGGKTTIVWIDKEPHAPPA